MKRLFSIILCICMMLTIFPTAFADFGGEIPDDEYYDDTAGDEYYGSPDDDEYFEDQTDIEEYYEDIGTIYDLEDEIDMPPEPEEEPPPKDPDEDDPDSEIYGDENFDAENALQLMEDHVADEIIVKFKEPWQVPGRERQLQREIDKVERIGFVEGLGIYVIRASDLSRNPDAVLNRLKNNRFIEYVELNYTMTPETVPNDANYRSQSLGLTVINATNGWSILAGSNAATVAVIDSGVANHPDLPPLLQGYSAVSGLSPNNDTRGHGTGVAGTIGCIGNNTIGNAGINWGASIMPVKIDDASGSISISNVVKGIMWAADNGARIINLSLGYAADSITLRNAIDYAYGKGCAIFAASGNESKNAVCYPARYDNVFAVGSTGNGSTRLASSNYGVGMNAVALRSYYTVTPSGGYTALAGTSFATPQVAGLASLILGINEKLTNDEVYRLIEQGCKPLGGGYNEQTGYGVIDMAKTLSLAQATVATPTKDTTPPVLTLLGSASMQINQGTAYVEPGYTAIDNVDGNITNKVTVTGTVNVNTPGTYTLTYRVADAAGNAATATRTVRVVDVTPPVLTLSGSLSMQIRQGQSYVEPGYTATDNVDGNITSRVTVTGTVNINTPGTYTLTYRVSDTAGNTSTATRTVQVVYVDTEPPVLTLLGSTSMQLRQGTAYVEPGYTAIDNVDGNITSRVTVTGTVNINTPGTYTLTYRVSDTAGNTSTATRTVTVIYVDTVPPVLTLIGGASVQVLQRAAFTEPGYTAIDNVDGDITSRVVVTGTVNTNTPGVYTLTYRVSDTAGNTSTATRTVTVIFVDNTPPVLTLSGSLTIRIDQGEAYVEPGYTAIDDTDGNITSRVVVTGSVAINVPGLYTLTYTVSDAAGNTSTATRTVTVVELPPVPEPELEEEEVPLLETPQEPPRTPPRIVLAGFAEMTLEYGQAYKEPGYLAADCNNLNLTSRVTVINNINIWSAGLYTVTYEVTDSAGVSARATRTVFVKAQPVVIVPPTAPKITINGSNPIILHETSDTPYKEQMAKAVDHDGTDISNLVRISSGSVNRTVEGTYTLTYSITSPTTGLTSTTTRDVRIVGPTTKRDPRTSYGLSGQAKTGAKITHAGVVSSTLGFMDLQVTSIDKNMTIRVDLIDTASKKSVLTDTFTAAGKKQYKIDQGKYELAVTIVAANGNSKYSISLLMPEAAPTLFYETSEVPLLTLPQIAPVGSNPIILHLGGTDYFEQGAIAVDFLGEDLSDIITITTDLPGHTLKPGDTMGDLPAGTYTVTYTIVGAAGIAVEVTREVRVLAPNEEGIFEEDEVPLTPWPVIDGKAYYTVQRGDSLYKIAKLVLGKGSRWGEVYAQNKDVIGKDPRMIRIGMELIICVE